jgi:hypothetical protein
MKKAMLSAAIMIALAIIPLTALADDVSIDANGNVTTGTSNSNANFEVTGGSAEDAVVGIASGTGASGVYGVNTDSNNFGLLGNEDYGVYGNSASGTAIYGMSPSGWAGYFSGNVHIAGDLSLTGSLSGYTETDPQVGTLTNGKWCTSDGSAVNCATNAPVTSETDPEVGSNTTNYVPKWNGSALVTGTIFDNGNVGIGTGTPNEQLEITGNLRLPSTTATTGIIRSGADTLIHTYGTDNFFAGVNAGNLTMTGGWNTAIGEEALADNTTGGWNTANGRGALRLNGTGRFNVAIGTNALFDNFTGSYNTASGEGALGSNTTGSYNTASGEGALGYNTTGEDNSALGYMAGFTATSANANTTGSNNTFIGAYAGPGTSTQLTNATAIGYNALVSQSNSLILGGTGADSVKVGIGTTSPSRNLVIMGSDPSLLISDDNYPDAGNAEIVFYNLITPAWSISNQGATGDLHIGQYGYGTKIAIQNLTGNVGIGTTSPAYTLDMAGHARVQGPDGFNSAGETAIIYYGDGNHYVKGTYAGGLNLNSANSASDPITFSFSGSEKVRITNTGSVGIGTTTPQGKLDVNGAIYQRGAVLHADYVFEPDYKLESIEEHAKFMWENKHLRAVPKAAVDENGLEVVEVGSHQKGIVEELEKAHIYIEQLQKEIKSLQERSKHMDELEKRLARLEAGIETQSR